MPLAFVLGIVVSLLTPERESEERFLAAERQIHLGAVATPTPVPTPPLLRVER